MKLTQLVGRLYCWLNKEHIPGGKVSRDGQWFQNCRVCGVPVPTSAPVKRKNGRL